MATSAGGAIVYELTYFLKLMGRTVLFVFIPIAAALTSIHYPYDTDATPALEKRPSAFYESAYQRDSTRRGVDYEETAKKAAAAEGIEGMVHRFVADHNLVKAKVLEVGSGRGYLQDVVADYTGLDLSPSVAKHYHKPFVVGSATEMPFADNTFDGVWTVWVMEHIPQPEKAFREMRRVVKPGGVMFLLVAWNCPPWAAEGFSVRPYSDFNWWGKAVKASIPIRSSGLFQLAVAMPVRTLRWAKYGLSGGGEPLHFRRIEPNYEVYWEPDSDAAISLDRFETYLWFRQAGDLCLNCGKPSDEMIELGNPLILKIWK